MKIRYKKIPLIVSMLIVSAAVGGIGVFIKSEKKKRQTAIYYWQDRFDPDSSKIQNITEKGIKKMYVKLFDVWLDYDEEVTAGSSIQQVTQAKDFEIVPVVFIVNEVLHKTKTTEDIKKLAYNIMKKSGCLAEFNTIKHGPNRPFKELQIDCDWTESTRDQYFELLRNIKKINENITLSVTLRLYPYKYRSKMGIPPADRAMLMVYNINKPADYNTANSIFTRQEAKLYLDGVKKYPLPLDIALPSFEWARIFHNKEFRWIKSDIPANFVPDEKYSKMLSPNRYFITKDTWFSIKNHYFYFEKNSEWVFDRISKEDLVYIADITKKIADKNATITFFELNQKFLQFNTTEINEILQNFNR